ncbi:hypothetical protein J3Q64DRAFT_1717373 [Phycomyces blakesleeanus]|uniref:Uncharacterized protein n=2 Tax=Phycomyces blakesleeanus TaxID=4837 RepID=A0A162V5E7_PHYB8|nr:hypothetical protein PHYBLDRAFT_163169 [Phycomyces blakesleeanus NRRL 1555(-)]OAD80122.1 hypothetical protein PHYBLDRAFT_163169 [Phycomyces blakesleeanus NRRL 1555(-)]|eukprot:XP_018298162.1 hypothetical protein PHYBLDRAFT_163169 [Phycomyces blakesleeanus NRRL 1555(-)]
MQNTKNTLQKPNALDSPIYEKPNAYEEPDQHNPPSPTEIPNQLEDSVTISPPVITITDRPNIIMETLNETKDHEPNTPPPPYAEKQHPRPATHSSQPGFVMQPNESLSWNESSASLASSTTSSTTNTSSSNLPLGSRLSLKKRPKTEVLVFDMRKHSLVRPHLHDIYNHYTKRLVYLKVQQYSYAWGFENILYRASDKKAPSEATKIVEARRRAHQKEITLEWGDYSEGNEASLKSDGLENKTKSNFLFVYETRYEGNRVRWKRPSLISHDMVCDIRPLYLDSEEDEGRGWRRVAEFKSHGMGYFIQLGRLLVDRKIVAAVDGSELFEALLILTCSTLVDLMREVVEKAVGLGQGGVACND